MATAAQQKAHEHYETRRDRRPRQTWWLERGSGAGVERAAPKGAKGAAPVKEAR